MTDRLEQSNSERGKDQGLERYRQYYNGIQEFITLLEGTRQEYVIPKNADSSTRRSAFMLAELARKYRLSW